MNITTALIISIIGTIIYLCIGLFFSVYTYICEHRRYGKVDNHWIGFSWCFWPIILIVYAATYLIASALGKPFGAVGNLTESIVDILVKDGGLEI